MTAALLLREATDGRPARGRDVKEEDADPPLGARRGRVVPLIRDDRVHGGERRGGGGVALLALHALHASQRGKAVCSKFAVSIFISLPIAKDRLAVRHAV